LIFIADKMDIIPEILDYNESPARATKEESHKQATPESNPFPQPETPFPHLKTMRIR
jgi:hypothetical protein